MAGKALIAIAAATGLWASASPAQAESNETAASTDLLADPADSVTGSVTAQNAALTSEEVAGHGRRNNAPEQETKQPKAFTLSADFALVSDYWSRGVTVSAGKPAFQPSLIVSHKSGLHASVWGSNVAANGGADIEIDASFGYAHSFGAVKADFDLIAYIYPGLSETNYLEVAVSLETRLGKATVNASAAYVPQQDSTGNMDSLYLSTGFDLPIGKTPLSLTGAVGMENGFFGDYKVDWQFGVKYRLSGFTFALSYADSARTFGYPDADAKPKAVFSIDKAF